MTIHWKALEEHILMVPLVFQFTNVGDALVGDPSHQHFKIAAFSQVFLPDIGSRLMTWFISFIDRTISSKTGTLPPTRPVLPPCGTTARHRSLQYFKISESSSVVFGFKISLLCPGIRNYK
jgi:hypothetical protein